MAIDEGKLNEFLGRFVSDLGATVAAGNIVIGHRLGLFRALAEGPATAQQLAERTDTSPRYIAEWLRGQAAGGYVQYDAANDTYSMTEEQVFALANPDGGVYMPGAFLLALGALKANDQITAAFSAGGGMGWHEHDEDVFVGCEQFFRPGYVANPVPSWLPALDGVVGKLRAGAKGADLGCGLGASTVLLGQAYPESRFTGSDYHERSIELARKRAADAGVTDRMQFEVARAAEFAGSDYDLITSFDCLHDMGDPLAAAKHVRSALAADGTWMVVEPAAADDVSGNMNPVGRVYYNFSVLMCPTIGPLSAGHEPAVDPGNPGSPFTDEPGDADGWALYNQHVWRRDYRKFVDFFWNTVFPEPHSTKPIEDATGWALETDPEVLIATVLAPPWAPSRDELVAQIESIRCPVLLIHGTDDAVIPADRSREIADLTGGDLLLLDGAGHCPHIRDPVVVNRAMLEFIDRVTPPAERAPRRTTWTRARTRPKKALYLSSPIGLGHARRDVAIAAELRKLHDDVQIDWLAQHPVTTVLAASGERVHPASAFLASESAHVEDEAGEHDLHAFQAIRRMDEILVANFSVLQDVVERGDYDLVIGDESWDLDYFWHENPELKRAAYVWMTDFVGWLPMPEGGAHEAMLTADYNAQMIEYIARFGRIRDRSIFIGEPDDIVPDAFGPGLPSIRAWTEEHYDFTGYDPAGVRQLAGTTGPPTAIATVGGSGVGTNLLLKVAEAVPIARKQIGDLRMIAVAGPRIDPARLPGCEGLDARGYVPDLHRHLAAADLAIVQGGLTTTMELVAARRPFLYFPLANHFEQQRHVTHRLDRHRAGRRMDYRQTDPDQLAAAIVEEIARPADYLPVASGGATRAATMIAELL